MTVTFEDYGLVCDDCAYAVAYGEGEELSLAALEATGLYLILSCSHVDDDDECENRPQYTCVLCKIWTFGHGHPTVVEVAP